MISIRKLLRRLGRGVLATVFLLTVAASAGLIWLLLDGVPAPLVRIAGDALRRERIGLNVARVRWQPWTTFTAEGVRLRTLTEGAFSLGAQRCDATLSFDAGTWREPRLESLWFRGGSMSIGGGALDVRKLGGEIRDQPDATTFRVSGDVGDLASVEAAGRIRRGDDPGVRQARRPLGETIAVGGEQVLGGFLAFRERVGFLELLEPAAITLNCDVDPLRASDGAADVSVRGGRALVRGMAVDSWNARAAWRDRTLSVQDLSVTAGRSAAHLTGAYTHDDGTFRGRALARLDPVQLAPFIPSNAAPFLAVLGLTNALTADVAFAGATVARRLEVSSASAALRGDGFSVDADFADGAPRLRGVDVTVPTLEGLLPALWSGRLADAGVELPAPMRLSWRGTADLRAPGAWRGEGVIGTDSVRVRGVGIDYSTAVFRRGEGDPAAAVDVDLFCAGIDGRGGGRIRGRWNGPDEPVEADVHIGASWESICALAGVDLPPELAALTHDGLVVADAKVSGVAGRPGALRVRGRVRGGPIENHGVRMGVVGFMVDADAERVVLSDIVLAGESGTITGRLTWWRAERHVEMEFAAAGDVTALCRFLGERIHGFVEPYGLAGLSHIDFAGAFNWTDSPADYEVDLKLFAPDAAVGRLAIRDFFLHLEATPGCIEVLTATGSWCGGPVEAVARIKPEPGRPGVWRCGGFVSLSQSDFAGVIGSFAAVASPEDYRGRMKGHATFDVLVGGDADPPATLTGRGWINISEGYILTLPIFGGLSRYLSVLLPGMGYLSQRDLRASFEVRDGAVRSQNIELLGRMVSIHGRGQARFDGDLDFRVEVKLLQDGLSAMVVRFFTRPITKALEFELKGTVKEPSWNMLNTPRRLLRFFKRSLGT